MLADKAAGEDTAVGSWDYQGKCEYLTNPLGMDVAQSRFSWKLEPVGPSRGQKQSAWQVMVETANGELLWDSGKVGSEDWKGIDSAVIRLHHDLWNHAMKREIDGGNAPLIFTRFGHVPACSTS